jgi:hypothetical protein
MKWAGYVACIGESKNLKEKTPLIIYKYKWVDNINADIKERV